MRIELENRRILPEMEQNVPKPAPPAGREHSLTTLLVWLGVLVTLFLIPMRVISRGYLPPDDGLRYPAMAVAGKGWGDVVIMKKEFHIDHNPGWNWILRKLHLATKANAETLAVVGVVSLALVVMLTPLFWLRRPEAWVGSLLASVIVFPEFLFRMFLGRPLAFSMAVTMALLLIWRKHGEKEKPSWPLLLASAALFASAVWVHGSWYLMGLIPTAFLLAGQWRNSLYLGACFAGGAFLGALLTGHPFAYLWNAVDIVIHCFSYNPVRRVLVGEFGPFDGAYPAIFLAVTMLVIRAVKGTWTWKAVNNPVFMLFLLSWILGLAVIRFWVDWGVPALALWIGLEIHDHLTSLQKEQSLQRVGITAAICAALFLGSTSDVKGRWTDNLTTEYLDAADPEMAPWLPGDGGIVYSSYMGAFYTMFFKNPTANWRYILGYESTFMPPEDLQILRTIQWNYHAPKAHEPWVAKMRPQDRMIMLGPSSTAPAIAGLEWKNVARETWVGRLPHQQQRPVGVPAWPVLEESKKP